jgi:hypothetical protein
MNEETRKALDWLMNRWPCQNDIIRSYPFNMVIFIAEQCVAYRKAEVTAEEPKP